MLQATRKFLSGNRDDANDDGILGMLHAVETAGMRMLSGIVMFVWETLPEIWRQVLAWLRRMLHFWLRVLVRLTRATVILTAWASVVFGPLIVWTGLVSFAWMALAIAGSIWGLRRHKHQTRCALGAIAPAVAAPQSAPPVA